MPDMMSSAFPEARAANLILEQIAHKWSIMILSVLCYQPTRFKALQRRLDGITHKALTEALRRLERNGLVTRHVIASSPVAVEYAITPLGQTLRAPFAAMLDWTTVYGDEMATAQAAYDTRIAAE